MQTKRSLGQLLKTSSKLKLHVSLFRWQCSLIDWGFVTYIQAGTDILLLIKVTDVQKMWQTGPSRPAALAQCLFSGMFRCCVGNPVQAVNQATNGSVWHRTLKPNSTPAPTGGLRCCANNPSAVCFYEFCGGQILLISHESHPQEAHFLKLHFKALVGMLRMLKAVWQGTMEFVIVLLDITLWNFQDSKARRMCPSVDPIHDSPPCTHVSYRCGRLSWSRNSGLRVFRLGVQDGSGNRINSLEVSLLGCTWAHGVWAYLILLLLSHPEVLGFRTCIYDLWGTPLSL